VTNPAGAVRRPVAVRTEVGMHVKDLVAAFYADVWNRGDLDAIPRLLREDFAFRGSLGAERRGHAGFAEYVTTVRGALADYRCDILDVVAEDGRAFARMRFSGVHVGELLGHPATGRRVEWLGAALFTAGVDGRLADVWVLGDLQALTAQLEK
jgi:steroid delta-isomerase-like uncharacterized protein